MKQFTIRDAEDHITSGAVELSATSIVPEGSVLVVTRSGILRHTLPVAVNEVPVAINQDLKGLELLDGIDSRYVAWALRRFEGDILHQCSKGGTTVQSIVFPRFLEFQVPVAPATEQRRIVAAIEEQFSRVDAGVSALQRARQNLQRMRATVLQAAVTGRLIPQDSGDEPIEIVLKQAGIDPLPDAGLPSLPRSWQWARFGDLLRLLRNGIFVSRPTDDPSGVPILRISAVRPLHLDLENVRYLPNGTSPRDLKPFFIATDDLLFTRYSGNPEFVGACAVVRRLPRATLHPDKLIRAVVNKEIAVARFLELATSAGHSRDHIRHRRRTTAGQTGISGGDLKSMPVPLPPLAEQTRIAQEVERQFSIIQALARAVGGCLERIASLRRVILSTAFQGRLVPQNSSEEPAEALFDRIRSAGAAHEPPARPGRRSRR